MHELEMPLTLAGLEIDAHETFGKEVVAGPVAAVVIGRRCLDRQVHEAELFVDADLRPHSHVAVEGHESFSHVSWPYSPGFGIVLNRQICLPVRTSKARTSPFVLLCVETVAPSRNDDPMMTDVADDSRRRVDADLAGLKIDLLIHALDDPHLQVEHALVRE